MPGSIPGSHGRIEKSSCGDGQRGLLAKEQHAPRPRTKSQEETWPFHGTERDSVWLDSRV